MKKALLSDCFICIICSDGLIIAAVSFFERKRKLVGEDITKTSSMAARNIILKTFLLTRSRRPRPKRRQKRNNIFKGVFASFLFYVEICHRAYLLCGFFCCRQPCLMG